MSNPLKANTPSYVSPEGDHLRTTWERFVQIAREIYEDEGEEGEELLLRMGKSAEVFWNALATIMIDVKDVDLVIAFIRHRATMLEKCAARLRAERINPNASATELQRPGGGEIM